jgi:hypothetical protein
LGAVKVLPPNKALQLTGPQRVPIDLWAATKLLIVSSSKHDFIG